MPSIPSYLLKSLVHVIVGVLGWGFVKAKGLYNQLKGEMYHSSLDSSVRVADCILC